MNYIKHLSTVLEVIAGDTRLNASHVSLYMALFQIWNQNRFENPVSINRMDTMRISKIGSRVTYHRCLNQLSEWNYLKYFPSHNPMKGSLIEMYIFGTSSEPTCGTTAEPVLGQLVGQVVDPSINSINNKKNNSSYKPNIDEVKDFFQDDLEAEKYFNYYSSKGWVVGNKSPMKDWKAAARNWKMNVGKFNSGSNNSDRSQNASIGAGHLHVDQNKDYSIPL